MNMQRKNKIKIAIGAVLFAIALVAVSVWYSMPSEQRNMMLFMMKSGDSYDNYKGYQVIEQNGLAPAPTSFQPVTATTTNNDYNSNITVIAGRMFNERSKMFKQAMVQPNGEKEYTGWHLIADEGFEEGVNTFGPSPLSYLTSGAAANLHTQILRAAEVMNVELENVKVEVLNKFYWKEMLSDTGAGFLGETHTNIIIESNAPNDTIQRLKNIALNSWTAGEAFGNETTIAPQLVVNGKHWESNRTVPGTSLSDESYVNDLKISHITDKPKKSEYLQQVSKDDDDMSNLTFEILAISESAENSDRPQLKKITVSFNTPSSETWELYSDELNGPDGTAIAPTSLEYLTAGTALCLTSQLTLVSAMMGMDLDDFRVEQQIDYRVENVNSTEMTSYADTVHTNVLIESNESAERLNQFYKKSLSLCFAGEAFKGATDMYTHCYLNGRLVK
jgi:uncharacterized OsmC-like protein